MKIITYETDRDAPPFALVKYAKDHGISLWDEASRADPGMIAFVESFLDNAYTGIRPARTDPGKLFHQHGGPGSDGIVRHFYGGWTDRSGDAMGAVATVCVNEYDEEAMKVYVFTNDSGDERLCPVFAFEPVDGVPGLFRMKDRGAGA